VTQKRWPHRGRSPLMRLARLLLFFGIIATLALLARDWLRSHPEHSPFAPLDLRDPVGMATGTKLASLRDDLEECRAVLTRSEVAHSVLDPAGEGQCYRDDRTRLGEFPLSPDTPPITCPLAAGLEVWRMRSVEPAAREILGSELVRIEHMGAYSCRRMYGASDRPWSEHSTGNAIDIAAFVLEDGQRISLIGDWNGDDDKARFLRRIRDEACDVFANVLSPDYNAAHADHFHFDQARRRFGACR
jgi:hypothetical protein